ncbi:HNH endonuclease signature motif containing protein, partial [Kribbella sindirgiensis]|uniref:HNH endonuclease signature motif containing protein n=1 Tax=Kribbella sindirgiensis TaxID=1124744 RepID=UPI0013F4288C
GVFVAPSDDHGTKQIWVRAAAGDVIRFDATIDDLARALKILGDPDDLDQRRAKALGWISDPAAAHQLLEVARYLARTQPTQEPPHPAPPNAAAAASGGAASDGAVGDGGADSAGDAAWGDPDVLDCTDFEHEPTPCDTAPSHHDSGDDPGDTGHTGDAECTGDVDDADAFTRRVLAGALPARLAAIKRKAYRDGLGAGSGQRNRHTLYVHLTDRTLATGNGVLRVEELGPLLASQLSELLGHDQIVVKPVIDLQDQVSVHSYEIPDRIRERVRLQHPVDMFPFGGAEATVRMDQDHIAPYERAGPPGQTTTDNLIPLTRIHHRAKTFGGWRSRRLPSGAVDWVSPHGFRFVVDYTGTHPVSPQAAVQWVRCEWSAG